jgi:hypothetical protein
LQSLEGAHLVVCVVRGGRVVWFDFLKVTHELWGAFNASALTIAAFDASAADTSSATNAAASPPDPAPLDAGSDHSDDAQF